MKIGILGAGHMGTALARRLATAGHELAIAARTPDEPRRLAGALGPTVRPVAAADVADGADLVILALPYGQAAQALGAVRRRDGTVVIDISNPLTPDMSGLVVGHTTSAAEEIQRAAPEVRVVKAFNTVFAQVLGRPPSPGDSAPVQVFYAGDDPGAKDTVRRVIASAGFEPVDAGPLVNARYLEPLGMLNIWLGYSGGRGTGVAPRWQQVG